MRLGELGPAYLRILISQQVALSYVLPLTVHLLLEEPLLDASFYEGDLLLAAVNAPAPAGALLPDLNERLRAVITTLPEAAVADLPRGGAEDPQGFSDPSPRFGGSRRRLCRDSSVVLVQTKGRGLPFQSASQLRMSCSRAWTERWTPPLSFFWVSSANHRSTRLSQDELVGMKCRWQRGCASNHFLMTALRAVRRQCERPPDPGDGRLRHPRGCRHGPG